MTERELEVPRVIASAQRFTVLLLEDTKLLRAGFVADGCYFPNGRLAVVNWFSNMYADPLMLRVRWEEDIEQYLRDNVGNCKVDWIDR